MTDTSAEAVAKLVHEREALSLAICGGEDAPGYAASLPVAVLEEVARSNRSSHIQALETVSRNLRHWRQECGKLHSRNDTLAARVAELEAALRSIIDLGGACGSDKYADAADYIARKALKGDE
jgi:hypothetical protein